MKIFLAVFFLGLSSLSQLAARPATCMAYWEGVRYNFFTDSCEWAGASGCSNPFPYQSEEECEADRAEAEPVVIPSVRPTPDVEDNSHSTPLLDLGSSLSGELNLLTCAARPSTEGCESTENQCAGGLAEGELKTIINGCWADGICKGVICLRGEDGELYLESRSWSYDRF